MRFSEGQMTEINPDVSDTHQWRLLRKLLDEPDTKFGTFLKNNGFPHNIKKYYAQIRNKNVQLMSLPLEQRANFIDIHVGASIDTVAIDIKQLPSVNRMNLVDLLASLPNEGKVKVIGILKDLPAEEQATVINLLIGL